MLMGNHMLMFFIIYVYALLRMLMHAQPQDHTRLMVINSFHLLLPYFPTPDQTPLALIVSSGISDGSI